MGQSGDDGKIENSDLAESEVPVFTASISLEQLCPLSRRLMIPVNKLSLARIGTLAYDLTGKIELLWEKVMGNIATTKMSSKGQVVIPEDIRKRLNLKAGSQFVVMGEKDVVILKAIGPPSMKEFDSLIAEARSQARRAGLKRSDVKAAVAKARGRK
jgi:AbrB family looped-hinge helix DNA binding protein